MKEKTEFEKFDKVMDGLLAVPYKELQQKLEENRQAKTAKRTDETRKPKKK